MRYKKFGFALSEVFKTFQTGNFEPAFTLAEVLITLGIIGVVAAMTLPSILQKQERLSTVVALKKFYSSFQNAINLSQLEHGPAVNWDTKTDYNDTDAMYVWFDEYVIQYMKILANCNKDNNKACFHTYSYATFPGESNIPSSTMANTRIMYIFQDGSAITAITGGRTESMSRVFHILFDTNGYRKPNAYGQDIFSFRYKNGKIYCDDHKSITGGSVASSDSRETLLDSCKNNPQTCTCLIMHDGWQIKDDYPW